MSFLWKREGSLWERLVDAVDTLDKTSKHHTEEIGRGFLDAISSVALCERPEIGECINDTKSALEACIGLGGVNSESLTKVRAELSKLKVICEWQEPQAYSHSEELAKDALQAACTILLQGATVRASQRAEIGQRLVALGLNARMRRSTDRSA